MDEIKDKDKMMPLAMMPEIELKEDGPKRAWDFDDKDLAMIGIVILGALGAFVVDDPASLIMTGMAALGALATGRKGNGRTSNIERPTSNVE